MSRHIVNIGIIGCGEVSQVIHIPTLNHMSDFYKITYLCDISPGALAFCSQKVINHIPKTTVDAGELCQSPDVDVVFVANADEYHVLHTLLALKYDKHVFVEKPMAMTLAGASSILQAEAASRGRVMVGYMRRYAAVFIDAVQEIGGLDKILYARIRGWLSSEIL
jgi:predicted dehydrogenase